MRVGDREWTVVTETPGNLDLDEEVARVRLDDRGGIRVAIQPGEVLDETEAKALAGALHAAALQAEFDRELPRVPRALVVKALSAIAEGAEAVMDRDWKYEDDGAEAAAQARVDDEFNVVAVELARQAGIQSP